MSFQNLGCALKHARDVLPVSNEEDEGDARVPPDYVATQELLDRVREVACAMPELALRDEGIEIPPAQGDVCLTEADERFTGHLTSPVRVQDVQEDVAQSLLILAQQLVRGHRQSLKSAREGSDGPEEPLGDVISQRERFPTG